MDAFMRSDVELRLAEYIGEVTEAGVFPANKAVVRETVGRHGEGDSHGCGRKAREIWTDGDKSSPGLIHLQA